MIKGLEFHSIIQNIFVDVNGYEVSEQLQVNCPRCQEREGLPHPDGKFNLEINTNRKVFRCWKCDEPRFTGSLRKLVRMYGSYADYEIYKAYAGTHDFYENNDDDDEYDVQVKLPDEMILFSEMNPSNLQHFEAYNYLVNDRKISRDIILKYRLGFCTTGKYANRVIIPSYGVNGDVNYFVARTYDPTIKNKKYDNPKSDKDKIIFNEGYINWDSTIYLVEGAFEMLSFPVNTIPMLGKTISSTLFMKLKELLPEVVIILDPDAYKNSVELFYTLQSIYVECEERVKIVKLPTNDDLDELRRNHGIDEVIKALYTARSLTVDDYFIHKLQNPYDRKGRYDSYSRNNKWESGSTKNFIR
jgi:DNA primase